MIPEYLVSNLRYIEFEETREKLPVRDRAIKKSGFPRAEASFRSNYDRVSV